VPRQGAMFETTSSADIPLPDQETARQLLEINLRDVPLASDVNLDILAKKTIGYSGADITNVSLIASFSIANKGLSSNGLQVCRDAAMMPMRRRIQGLSPEQIKNLPKGGWSGSFYCYPRSEIRT
jgi:katanin p60 ATPase-containing subunit A1